MIKWIVPKVDAIMTDLVWVNQRMIKSGPIEEGFMEDKDVDGPRERTIICSGTRYNRNIEERLHGSVI